MATFYFLISNLKIFGLIHGTHDITLIHVDMINGRFTILIRVYGLTYMLLGYTLKLYVSNSLYTSYIQYII
ncbi:hypothetical protein BDQ12DRAFT_362192 [Crucibulum laeve]|uniref:Uncharacterized protein n=1 Tax=Crucibulum laeve TaxID=68775 RepID=A0A5C3LRN2_9AGAR|nr:hypothetical protein BDQ12DRAFT_362192 [Crucibulum laeve]